MPHARSLSILAAASLLFVAASPAVAQAPGTLSNAPIDLQVFRPAVDSKGFITLNASQILAQKDFSFGLVTTWARRPLSFSATVANEASTWAVDNLITSSFQGAVGLFSMRQFGLELGISVPINIMSGRADPSDTMNTESTNDDKLYKFDAQGLGDITIHPKIRLMNASRNKVGLAIIPSVVLPTGSKDSFFGEGKVIFQPSAVLDLELGTQGWFRAAVNVGARIRPQTQRFVEDAASFPRPASTCVGMMSRRSRATPTRASRSATRSSPASASRSASCPRSSTWSARSTPSRAWRRRPCPTTGR